MPALCLVKCYTYGVMRATRLSGHCLVGYRADVPYVRKTPQRTVGIDDELWADVQAIAKAKRERVSAVIRSALVRYRDDNRAVLEEIKRETHHVD